MKLKLKMLGADNAAGVFERGGDLDVVEIHVHDVRDIAEQVVHATGCALEDAKNPTAVPVRKGLWLVHFVGLGEAVVVSAEEEK